ncbi:hypothetical protein SAMN05660297_01709 [Natronincola peptidivorans]|uniref:Uncharacterized protein n=1 Tax=Natronincola peptidivorans TaxID=426128 RepID=A0A1I0CR74_9FIRM|nr:hypothetical protein [Natronincola peptidivorans]SET21807.1 hypothetical protein SAMN05660297_01709 [Natronincola peptidivorans]
MQILYAKYNRERLPKFQLETIIYKDGKTKKVKKKALTNEAGEHIKAIFNNYLLLSKNYKHIKVAEARLQNDEVIFEYISGNTLEQLMITAISNRNKDGFFSLINRYLQYVKTFSADNSHKYSLDDKFQFSDTNQEWTDLFFLDSTNFTNLDITFDNLIQDLEKEFIIIDYEWIFPFNLPMEYVVFRAINNFYMKHHQYLESFIEINEIYKYCEIDLEDIKRYNLIEIKFQNYVSGEKKKHITNDKFQHEVINIRNVLHETSLKKTTKLYIDLGNGYCESNSIICKTQHEHRLFEVCFNLLTYSKKLIQSIRWDPIEDRLCKVKINSIWYVDCLGEKNYIDIDNIYTNESIIENEFFVFKTFDPMVFFENINDNLLSFHISGEWEILSNYEFEKRYLIKILQERENLEERVLNKKNKIRQLQDDYVDQSYEMKQLQDDYADQSYEMKQLQDDYANQSYEMKQLKAQISIMQRNLDELKSEFHQQDKDLIEQKKYSNLLGEEINMLKNSNSWKITAPLRKAKKVYEKIMYKK